MNKITTYLASALAALALVCGLGACTTSESFMTLDINDETGALMIEASNADGVVSSAIEIGEGDVLQLSPFFDKGGVQVQLLTEDETVVFDETVDGKVLSIYEVEPGTYTISVAAQGGTTGTMTIIAANADEVAAIDASLEEAVGEAAQEAEAQD